MLPAQTDMHLIVLDDDESTALFMATVARKLGWTAQTVTDESNFQALISAAPPDAILLDLQLGASDGVEQLRFLRSVGYSGTIVLMSGFDARVLASAQQIGESLGLTIAAVLQDALPNRPFSRANPVPLSVLPPLQAQDRQREFRRTHAASP